MFYIYANVSMYIIWHDFTVWIWFTFALNETDELICLSPTATYEIDAKSLWNRNRKQMKLTNSVCDSEETLNKSMFS